MLRPGLVEGVRGKEGEGVEGEKEGEREAGEGPRKRTRRKKPLTAERGRLLLLLPLLEPLWLALLPADDGLVSSCCGAVSLLLPYLRQQGGVGEM